MTRINDILDTFNSHHSDGDTTVIQRAYIYASRKHEGQTRKSGQPYLIHPMEVARMVAEMGLCEPSICAALLHDTIEDTDTTRQELTDLFGEDVGTLVEGMTKLSKVAFKHHEERQAESFRKMLLATVQDIRVLLIKLADRLHNMSTLKHLKPEKQERISLETREIYAPLANRLGISWMQTELDDLSFKYLEADAYKDLVKVIAKTKKTRAAFIEKIKTDLATLSKAAGFEVAISGRLKNLWSIHKKMMAKHVEYAEIHDAIAFRVICDSVSDCYAIFGLIHAKWVPVPGRIKDFIAMPKPNYYRSLHTTVMGSGGERMEIQLRTRDMHDVAEHGVAAHWEYKEHSNPDAKKRGQFKWLREILDQQDEVDDSREFLDSVKVDLFHDEVFVFTPAGDVKSLRKGATPLDFAFAIHSEVGNSCTGARINGIQAPFGAVLKNGDRVEIVTSKSQRPRSDWLDIAVTSKARNKIRAYLRTEQREQSLQAGRELLEKGLRKMGVSFNRIHKAGEIEKIAPDFKFTSADEVIGAVGNGKLEKNVVIAKLIPEDKKKQLPQELKESTFEKVIRKVKGEEGGIVLDGVDNLLIRFGRCCNPLPGEDVTGYVSRGRGIVVHRRNCAKLAALDAERQTHVQWSSKSVSQRPVRLQVITGNRPGLLAELSSAFLAKGINISSAHCDTHDTDRAVNTFTFQIKDVSQLNVLIKTLKQSKGVYEVDRLST